jgi:hypothetical protein
MDVELFSVKRVKASVGWLFSLNLIFFVQSVWLLCTLHISGLGPDVFENAWQFSHADCPYCTDRYHRRRSHRISGARTGQISPWTNLPK